MADVRPFAALRYNPAVEPDLGAVIAPPYDVISPTDQQACLQRNLHNVIRLELGPLLPDDMEDDNRYTRARATLDQWLSDGVLRQDHGAAFYAYGQEFTHGGSTQIRRGLFAAVGLEPWDVGVVKPHEKTLARPKADRLELLRATRTNISPVFALYADRAGAVNQAIDEVWSRPSLAECVDMAGEKHRLWAVDDRDRCTAITAALADVSLYIADGHHRYETALAYRDEHIAEARGEPASEAGRVLMTLVEANDPGLVVLPTHRLVSAVSQEGLANLGQTLARDFAVEDLADDETAEALLSRLAVAGNSGPAFILAGPGHALRLLRPRQGALPANGGAVDVPQALQALDVWMIHTLLLEQGLGLDAASATREEHLSYTRDAAEALARVRNGSAQLALFLNPTPVQAIMDVADAGATMPQKSTYFYPKLITGLVMRLLR